MNDTTTIIAPAEPVCEDISCNEKLGYFDKKNHSRFCHKCRVSQKIKRWKCKGCPNIIYSSEARETRKYCLTCRGVVINI